MARLPLCDKDVKPDENKIIQFSAFCNVWQLAQSAAG